MLDWLRRLLFRSITAIDGDTIRQTNGRPGRILGIDAPEISQPGGLESKAYLDYLLHIAGKVECRVVDQDRYGRDIVILEGADDIGRIMVREGTLLLYGIL